jgi:hypothetical protein
MIRQAFNCGEEAYRFEAQTSYYDDGTRDFVPANSFPTAWKPVPPDTMVNLLMVTICTWGKK